MAIQSFADKAAKTFFKTGTIAKHSGWKAVAKIVLRKLDMLHYAHELGDLKSPPGNSLEALKRRLEGFYSIRVNQQWRIIFEWTPQGPCDVQIVDHR